VVFDTTELIKLFKRQRISDIEASSHSATDGRASCFRDNPSSASSPHELIVHEGRRESAPEDRQAPPTVKLPAILQQALDAFKIKRWWRA